MTFSGDNIVPPMVLQTRSAAAGSAHDCTTTRRDPRFPPSVSGHVAMSALDEAAQEPTADCSTPGCDKAGTMACPTCIKLGLPPSRYCAQVS